MAIADQVKDLLVEQLGVEPDELTDNADIWNDLGADSLDVIEVQMALEEELGITVDEDEFGRRVKTVADLITFVDEKVKAKKQS